MIWCDLIEICHDLIALCRDLIESCRDIISTNNKTDNMSRKNSNRSRHNSTKLCRDLFRILPHEIRNRSRHNSTKLCRAKISNFTATYYLCFDWLKLYRDITQLDRDILSVLWLVEIISRHHWIMSCSICRVLTRTANHNVTLWTVIIMIVHRFWNSMLYHHVQRYIVDPFDPEYGG